MKKIGWHYLLTLLERDLSVRGNTSSRDVKTGWIPLFINATKALWFSGRSNNNFHIKHLWFSGYSPNSFKIGRRRVMSIELLTWKTNKISKVLTEQTYCIFLNLKWSLAKTATAQEKTRTIVLMLERMICTSERLSLSWKRLCKEYCVSTKQLQPLSLTINQSLEQKSLSFSSLLYKIFKCTCALTL